MMAFLLPAAAWALSPVLLNTFPLKHPGFLSADESFANSKAQLLITEFSPFGTDSVSYLADMKQVFNKTVSVTTLSTQVSWPNEASQIPVDVFKTDAIVVATGFFPNPNKATGSVVVFNLTSPKASQPIKLSTDKKNYFYHRVLWHDINGDGRADAVTARVQVPTGGKAHGELLWLEQPAANPFGNPWTEHVIVEGPDVFFRLVDIDGDGKYEIITAEFFTSSSLVIYWCEDKLWSNCGPSNTKSRAIDTTIGKVFDLSQADLNNDGVPDLLVTNNMADGSGAVFAYEVPKDYQKGTFVRHVLKTGFKPHSSTPGQGSPGSSKAFFPTKETKTKPAIIVSGDDSGEIYILDATSQDPSNWNYSATLVCKSTGTVGEPAVADINGDGIKEFFVPYYSEEKVEVYTFK